MFGQSATLRRLAGTYGGDGVPVYGAASTVLIRYEEGSRRVVDAGVEGSIAKTRTAFLPVEVAIGDELTIAGRVYHVAGLVTVPTLDGVVTVWEAWLE